MCRFSSTIFQATFGVCSLRGLSARANPSLAAPKHLLLPENPILLGHYTVIIVVTQTKNERKIKIS
jgi:hypothetical protein